MTKGRHLRPCAPCKQLLKAKRRNEQHRSSRITSYGVGHLVRSISLSNRGFPLTASPVRAPRVVKPSKSLGETLGFAKLADEHVREGRFQRSLSLIAGLSGLLAGLEVTYEHYRGSYSRRIMYTPVILSGALLGAGLLGFKSKKAARTVLPLVSAITLADGFVGFCFHVRGIQRKPGGWRIPIVNMVMGPPVF